MLEALNGQRLMLFFSSWKALKASLLRMLNVPESWREESGALTPG